MLFLDKLTYGSHQILLHHPRDIWHSCGQEVSKAFVLLPLYQTVVIILCFVLPLAVLFFNDFEGVYVFVYEDSIFSVFVELISKDSFHTTEQYL